MCISCILNIDINMNQYFYRAIELIVILTTVKHYCEIIAACKLEILTNAVGVHLTKDVTISDF